MKRKVLVAGFATRHVVQSAANAGYEVCAVDHFCDQDLCWNTIDREKFCDLADLPDAIHTISKRHTFDHFIVTSGAEELPTFLPLCGTPKDKIARFMDKLDIQHFFEDNNVPVPRLLASGEYPAMVKPRKGAGGWRNTIVRDADESLCMGKPVSRDTLYPPETRAGNSGKCLLCDGWFAGTGDCCKRANLTWQRGIHVWIFRFRDPVRSPAL